jgi:hypothetical protein
MRSCATRRLQRKALLHPLICHSQRYRIFLP